MHTYNNTGIIGLAGGTFKSAYPSSWGEHASRCARLNVYQANKEEIVHDYINPYDETYSEVLILDGVFMFVRKYVWEQIRFDENTFEGFHLYDLDFSFHVNQYYKNYVCYSIKLKHYSLGSFGREWMEDGIKFTEKWAKELPKSIHSLGGMEESTDSFCLYRSIRTYIEMGLPLKYINKYLFIHLKKYLFTKRTPTILIKYLRYRLTGR